MTIPRIGVGVAVVQDNKLLLLRRRNAHGEGTWAFPGGHLEFNETIITCAERETLEETGLSLINPRIVTFTEDFFERENKHYITFIVMGQATGIPTNKEPHKCDQLGWFSWDNLPQPYFIPLANLKKQSAIEENMLQYRSSSASQYQL